MFYGGPPFNSVGDDWSPSISPKNHTILPKKTSRTPPAPPTTPLPQAMNIDSGVYVYFFH